MIPHSRPSICEADINAVCACLRSGMIAEGDGVTRLERRLAERYGFPEAIVVGSGSQALRLALEAFEVGPGARVASPTYVCPEVLGVVEAIGATAALADVGEDYLLDEHDRALDGVDAIVLPALLGSRASAQRYTQLGAPVIADWAQYAPCTARDDADAFDIAIVSFEATKLVTAGEGGAVLVRNPEQAARLRALKQVSDTTLKLNLYPLSDLQASLVLSQLDRLDAFLERRSTIAQRYANAVGTTIMHTGSAHFRFITRVEDAGELLIKFAEQGVVARRPVDPLLHHVRPQKRSFPVADILFNETISLPCYPALSDDEISHVANVARELLT